RGGGGKELRGGFGRGRGGGPAAGLENTRAPGGGWLCYPTRPRARRYKIGNVRMLRHDKRQGAGPELGRQVRRKLRPAAGYTGDICHFRHVDDDWVVSGSPFGHKYPAHSLRIEGIRSKAINRFRRERHQSPGAKDASSLRQDRPLWAVTVDGPDQS